MKKSTVLSLVLSTLLLACSADDMITFRDIASLSIDTADVEAFIADGKSKLLMRLVFNEDAKLEDIVAKASITNASFENKTEKEITLTPKIRMGRNSRAQIVAETSIISTTKADSVFVEFNVNNYILRFPFLSKKSEPAAIKLTKSKTSIESNYRGEVTITGLLSNIEGGKVSQGTKVVYSDFLESGEPAGGLFRAQEFSSNLNSQVSAIYSAGAIQSEQFVTIKAEVIDQDNNPIGIESTIEVFVISN